MNRLILIAVAAGALAACSHHATFKPPAAKLLAPASTAPSAVIATPTPVKGLNWFMSEDGATAKLAYGAQAGDDSHMTFVCAKGSGKVAMSRPVPADQAAPTPILNLGSGDARGHYLADAQTNGDHAVLSVKAMTTEPLLDAFQRNGWLATIAPDGKIEGMAPQPGDTSVRRFFAWCG